MKVLLGIGKSQSQLFGNIRYLRKDKMEESQTEEADKENDDPDGEEEEEEEEEEEKEVSEKATQMDISSSSTIVKEEEEEQEVSEKATPEDMGSSSTVEEEEEKEKEEKVVKVRILLRRKNARGRVSSLMTLNWAKQKSSWRQHGHREPQATVNGTHKPVYDRFRMGGEDPPTSL